MLKYSLIIEGTEKEIKDAKSDHYDHRIVWNLTNAVSCDLYFHRQSGRICPEYKVVEPLHIELTQYVDIDGQINLRGCGILPRHAGKKVKVVISEETD